MFALTRTLSKKLTRGIDTMFYKGNAKKGVSRWLCKSHNSITLASSELAPNMFGASSELASVMEFGREPASSC